MNPVSPPVFSIKTVAEATQQVPAPYFMPNAGILRVPMAQPYRTTYYGIGLCTAGTAVLMAGLQDYALAPGSLITLSPTVIKQWKFRSDDYDNISIFFQADFLLNNPADQPVLDSFALPGHDDNYVLVLNEADCARIHQQLVLLQQLMAQPSSGVGTYRDETVRHLIWALLYQTAALHHHDQPAAAQSRRTYLTNAFRKLVNRNAPQQHSVGFYADQLAVTPKHLTETLKETTGRTAGDWIDEALTLEARILLANPTLTVAQIADQLHFPDQSTFGKFFKKQIGVSPVAYRK